MGRRTADDGLHLVASRENCYPDSAKPGYSQLEPQHCDTNLRKIVMRRAEPRAGHCKDGTWRDLRRSHME